MPMVTARASEVSCAPPLRLDVPQAQHVLPTVCAVIGPARGLVKRVTFKASWGLAQMWHRGRLTVSTPVAEATPLVLAVAPRANAYIRRNLADRGQVVRIQRSPIRACAKMERATPPPLWPAPMALLAGRQRPANRVAELTSIAFLDIIVNQDNAIRQPSLSRQVFTIPAQH